MLNVFILVFAQYLQGMSQCTDDISKLQSFESSLEKESSNLGRLLQELESIKVPNFCLLFIFIINKSQMTFYY